VRSLALFAVVLALLGCRGPVTDTDGGSDVGPSDAGRDAPQIDAALTWTAAPFTPTPETIAYCQGHDDAMIEAHITELLSELTLDQKIALMHGASSGTVDGTWLVAGVPALGIPGFHMLDGPRGLSRFTGLHGTAWPVGMMRGATWDPALERRVGVALAEEHRSAGADVVLAPTINILRHPRWGRAQETYGEDTHHLGEMGLAFVEGVQSEHLLASVKHFAGNSIENTRHSVNVVIDERTLREVYLPHFRRVIIDGHAGSVMSAYNQLNGLYCDEQPHLLTDILREDWGYAGFVESDWLLGTHASAGSVHAGLDIEMPGASHFRDLRTDFESGALDQDTIDGAVRRILRGMFCFGLETGPTRTPGTQIDDRSQRETPAHLELAREVARRGLVLLRNESHALPIDAAVHSIVVLGRNATEDNIGDDGSSDVTPSNVVSALEGLTARAGSGVIVTRVAGTTLDAAATAMVSAADVAIVVTGLQNHDEGEGDIGAGDRHDLNVPDAEVALVHAVAAVNARTIVVLEGGAALITRPWENDVEAIVFAFYPGSSGGTAIADVLFGDFAPSGRLPFSIPVLESDLPTFDDVSATVTYDYLHGYRWLAHASTAPAYPFGFGLSYTTFSYANLRVSSASVHAGDTVDVTVTVTNDGETRAIDTVQLYVSARASSVLRAPEDLRAFGQIDLAAHASADVTLTLHVDDLRYWDVATSTWVLEPIDYALHVGAHAGDAAALTSTIHAS
jgi:beta-glucosidase